MVFDEKHWETRGRRDNFKGRWAIHASKGFPRECRELCDREPFKSALARHGITSWEQLMPTLGHILGSVEQVGCVGSDVAHGALSTGGPRALFGCVAAEHELSFGDYSADRYVYVTSALETLSKPVFCKGALGLWRIPPETLLLAAA